MVSAAIPLAGLFKAMVIGAVVGAVVGGLTAAIKGGDIFKGVLFGAIGGAVTGGLLYGVDKVITGMVATTTTSTTNAAAGTMFGAETARGVASGAITPTVTEVAAPSFFGGIMDDIGNGFKDVFGEGVKDSMGAGALAAGIGGVGQMYTANKTLAQQKEEARLNREQEMAMLEKNIASNEKIASSRSGGGGGGGGSLNADEQLMLIKEQNAGALARVNAEIAGQSDLKNQEFARADRIRQTAADAGAGLSASERTVASTSTESLVDLQERIRAGEDIEGNPSAGYDVPVDYVPPTPTDPKYVV